MSLMEWIRHLLGWVLRPRRAYLRLRERWFNEQLRPIRNDLPIDDLPIVDLVDALSEPELVDRLFYLYYNNPSPLARAPVQRDVLDRSVVEGTEYYLAFDGDGEVVGCVGFEPWRSMVVHLVVDYARRGRGLGLAILKSLVRYKEAQGYREIQGQVFKGNARALSLYLSLGFSIIEGGNRKNYYTLFLPLRGQHKLTRSESENQEVTKHG